MDLRRRRTALFHPAKSDKSLTTQKLPQRQRRRKEVNKRRAIETLHTHKSPYSTRHIIFCHHSQFTVATSTIHERNLIPKRQTLELHTSRKPTFVTTPFAHGLANPTAVQTTKSKQQNTVSLFLINDVMPYPILILNRGNPLSLTTPI